MIDGSYRRIGAVFFMAGYNARMKLRIIVTSIGLFISSLLLISTINLFPVEHTKIPFTASSGVSGEIKLDLPTKVLAGDKGKIRLQFILASLSGGESPDLLVHLESGVETIDPSGLVKVKIRNSDPVLMNWVFQIYQEGEYPGTLWVWLQTDDDQELLLGREIRLVSSRYLGSRVFYFRITYAILWLVCGVGLILSVLHEKKRK
jgi:hypothetical protein